MKADLLVDCDNILGEGVQWNADHQRVWWSDIHGRKLWSCDADGGGVETIPTAERLGSFAFDAENNILAAFESGLFRWDIERDRLERLTDFEPDHPGSRLNDGRCDRQGRFIVGGIDEDGMNPTTTLTRYGGGEVEVIRGGIRCSNSICFSPDGDWMYFADTPTKTIDRYPYDPESGRIGAPEAFLTVSGRNGFPDGSCVDAEGALWNARFWGACVQRILPDGTEDTRVEIAAPQVTCACFGGPDLDRLYVTTAQENLPADQKQAFPLSGGLFVAETDFVGLPESHFAGNLFG